MTKRKIQAAEYRAEAAILDEFDLSTYRGRKHVIRRFRDNAREFVQSEMATLRAEIASVRQMLKSNRELNYTLVLDKAVNQSAKQELAKVFGDLTITELAQKAIEAKRFLDQELTDWAATDTYCRAKAAEVLPEFEVYGDKESVPPIEAIVDKLVECVSPKRKEDRAGVAVTPKQD